MAKKKHKPVRPDVLRSAGRTALSVLRHTRMRAKLGTLHLPLDLHPLRQRSIVLPVPADADPAREQADPATPVAPGVEQYARHAQPGEETRALRGRLGMAERRMLRLRQALERERRARAQATAAIAQPRLVIDHLVADLSQIDVADTGALRRTIAQVLGAYGFAVADDDAPLDGRQSGDDLTLPAVPGWDRTRLRAAVDRILARNRETGSRYVVLALAALVRDDAVTPAAIAREAGLTSALARHRTRVALDGLCAVGIARRDGERFALGRQGEDGPRRKARRR